MGSARQGQSSFGVCSIARPSYVNLPAGSLPQAAADIARGYFSVGLLRTIVPSSVQHDHGPCRGARASACGRARWVVGRCPTHWPRTCLFSALPSHLAFGANRNVALVYLIHEVTAGQQSAYEGVLLADGSLNGSALQIPTSEGIHLTPQNLTHSRVGCYDGAAQLHVFFGLLQVPVISTEAVRPSLLLPGL